MYSEEEGCRLRNTDFRDFWCTIKKINLTHLSSYISTFLKCSLCVTLHEAEK